MTIVGFFWIVAALPLAWSWAGLQGTSLRYSLLWVWTAWGFSGLMLSMWLMGQPHGPWLYLMLVWGCGVLVAPLGAKEPGAAAWNFVVAGLLAVLALPLLEQPWRAERWSVDGPRSLFILFILLVGGINYLPTRHGWSALIVMVVLGLLLHQLQSDTTKGDPLWLLSCAMGGMSWAAWLAWLNRRTSSGQATAWERLNQRWLNFRDRYGMVWSLRVLEQTNRSLHHQKLPLKLHWFGWTASETPPTEEALERADHLLGQILRRFQWRHREESPSTDSQESLSHAMGEAEVGSQGEPIGDQ